MQFGEPSDNGKGVTIGSGVVEGCPVGRAEDGLVVHVDVVNSMSSIAMEPKGE